jgi:hypothetical protein
MIKLSSNSGIWYSLGIITTTFCFKIFKLNSIFNLSIMDTNDNTVHDWQVLVNKPVFASDGKEVGIVRSIQPDTVIVSYGSVTPDKYLIPKSSIKNFSDGILYLNETSETIDRNYRFE